MAKLLHTADWQIGKQFDSFDTTESVVLRLERFAVVERIAQMANDRNVDVVLVAGDVFDKQNVSEQTVRRLIKATAAFKGHWVFLPGNHDAAEAESVWACAQRLDVVPANVHLCLTPNVLQLEDVRIAVLPAPLLQRHTQDDVTAWFDEAQTPEGYLRIGLAHGRIEGVLPGDSDAKNLIPSDTASRARLDYLALGDWHGTFAASERIWYSGTPEQDSFRDNDTGNALIVELAPDALPTVVRERVGRFRWHKHEAKLDVPSDVDMLVEHLATYGRDDVVQLVCTGALDLAGLRRLSSAVEETRAVVPALRDELDAVRLTPSEDDIRALQADGYVADLLAELRDQQDGSSVAEAEAQLARNALIELAKILQDGAISGAKA